jgi:nucleoid-associated protein YgaU
MFSPGGNPLRATVDLSIRGIDLKAKPPALESPDRTKRRLVTQDTRLDLIANDVYRDCSKWRGIAVANNIQNPRKLTAGITLNIPPLSD